LLNTPDKDLLTAAVVHNTINYFIAALKAGSNYIISPDVGSENSVFFKSVIGIDPRLDRTKIYYVPDSMAKLRDNVFSRFSISSGPGLIAYLYYYFSPFLNLITSIFITLIPFIFFYSFLKKIPILFISTGIILGYLGMHAFSLLMIDRYAAPILPLVFFSISYMTLLIYKKQEL
jgi:hypothetical protein